MYEVDGDDRAIAIEGIPASSPGAPLPIVMANEHVVVLAYLASNPDPDWDGTYVRVVDDDSLEPAVVVRFDRPSAHMLGPPNDETLHGHPLWNRGLSFYGIFRVEHSSWIRGLRAINSVHDQANSKAFSEQTHFIFTFHDTTFECIAASITAQVHPGPLTEVTNTMRQMLHSEV
jgi:hypothetical protein